MVGELNPEQNAKCEPLYKRLMELTYAELQAVDLGKSLKDIERSNGLDAATIEHMNMWFVHMHDCNGCSHLLRKVRWSQVYEIGKEAAAQHYINSKPKTGK
jgi:hypothetical protein